MESLFASAATANSDSISPAFDRRVFLSDFSRFLVDNQIVSGELIARFDFAEARQSGRALQALWQHTGLSVQDFADEVGRYASLPRAGLRTMLEAPSLAAKFSRRFLVDAAIYPFGADGLIQLAVCDPSDSEALHAAEIVLGEPFRLVVASFEDLATVLAARIDDTVSASPESGGVALRNDDDVESLRDLASGAPVVRAVNELLEKAVQLRATDIHIEPFRTALIVRMRIDGVLRRVPTPAGALPQALISRVKILSGLNIAERRLPQDGAARLQIIGTDIDVRVATAPTQHGETMAIRLLPKDTGLLDIGRLGMSPNDERKLSRLLAMPHGMIIVTGPTGSGKTTTLATMLTVLNDSTRKILTIEDPVEYEIQGINQTQVKPGIGLTFATALRSFLRHDPDVIMVGEVRDSETAHIAVHAALTGHLVLTTLHTENAASAMVRLRDLGIEGFLLASMLRGVIAQRLVRVLCDRCKQRRTLEAADLAADARYAAFGLAAGDTVYEPGRCDRCGGTGYRGRNGVFEVLEVNDEIRALIAAEPSTREVERAALRGEGMTTMRQDALLKCHAGLTSPGEILRVVALG